MLKIASLVFNPFQENTYIVSEPSGGCIIVDGGNYFPRENDALDNYISSNNLKPVMLFNTHGHIDHILGINYLKNKYGIPLAIRSEDVFLLENSPKQGELFGFDIKDIPVMDIDLKEMDKITLGQYTLDVIHTPGHTPGHTVLYSPENKFLLTGDTLFRESIGRTDLPGGDYSWIMKSILEKILPLGEDVHIYPGHGPSSTIGHEMLYNPFITEVLGGEVNP